MKTSEIKVNTSEIRQEYERLKGLFEDSDEKLLAVMEGLFWEAARCRVELDRLHEIATASGLILIDKNNPMRQKELPVSRQLVRTRASYLNHMSAIAKALGKTLSDDYEDDGFEDYE